MSDEGKTDSELQSNETRPPTGERYKVGYKRPPLETRFRPGVSGNPRGRTTKAISWDEMIAKVASDMREIRKPDGTRETMSYAEIVARALFTKAANGSAAAFRSLVPELRKASSVGQRRMTKREYWAQAVADMTWEEKAQMEKLYQELQQYFPDGSPPPDPEDDDDLVPEDWDLPPDEES